MSGPSSAGLKPALRSAPEEKPRPAPVISTARTDVGGAALDFLLESRAELVGPGVQRVGPVERHPPDALVLPT